MENKKVCKDLQMKVRASTVNVLLLKFVLASLMLIVLIELRWLYRPLTGVKVRDVNKVGDLPWISMRRCQFFCFVHVGLNRLLIMLCSFWGSTREKEILYLWT